MTSPWPQLEVQYAGMWGSRTSGGGQADGDSGKAEEAAQGEVRNWGCRVVAAVDDEVAGPSGCGAARTVWASGGGGRETHEAGRMRGARAHE